MSSDKTSSDISPDRVVEMKIVPDFVDEMLKDLTKIPKALTRTHMQQLGVYFGDTPVVQKRIELMKAVANGFNRMIEDHLKSDHKEYPIYVHSSLLFYWSSPFLSHSEIFKELNPNAISVIQWILKEYKERLSDEENEHVKRYLSALLSVNYAYFKPQRSNSRLIWGSEPNEKNVHVIALEIANQIAKPLKDFYEEHLLKKESPLLHLKCDNEQLKLNTQSSLFGREWIAEMTKWAVEPPATLILLPERHELAKAMFRKMGLDFESLEKSQFESSVDVYNPSTKQTDHIVYTTPLGKDTVITEVFFQIANRLAPIFNEVMTDIFVDAIKSVRTNNTEKKDDKDDNKTQTELAREDIIQQGIQYGPVKTIGRASVKSREYSIVPGITSVKDWVRVALIVENESECVELFNKIMKQFDGKIARVKNGFDPKIKGEDVLHYRSILINLVFDYATYGKLDQQKEKHKHQSDDLGKAANEYWKMICEVQIILREYLNVRSRLHLYYKILRCMERDTDTTASKVANDFSKYWELPE